MKMLRLLNPGYHWILVYWFVKDYRYAGVRLSKPPKMLKLFKRFSKPVNTEAVSDNGDLSSVVNPVDKREDKRELLTRYVGRGKEKEPLRDIFEKNNVGKYCRVTVRDKCLIVSELTDVEVVRIAGDQIKRCLQDTTNETGHNCVAVIVGENEIDGSTYLFETCSVKEVCYVNIALLALKAPLNLQIGNITTMNMKLTSAT